MQEMSFDDSHVERNADLIVEDDGTHDPTHSKSEMKKKKERKVTLEEKLYASQITSIMDLLPVDAKYSLHPSSISAFPKKGLMILQTNSGLYFFKSPIPKLLCRMQPSEAPIIIPSSGFFRNLSEEVFLALWPNPKRITQLVMAIVCPKTQRVIRKLFTEDRINGLGLVSFSSGRLISYFTSSYTVVSYSVKSMTRVVRPLGLPLKTYLDSNLGKEVLDSLSFEGLLVEWILDQELIVLWGKWTNSPFICIFYKKLMMMKLAVFTLLSAFQTNIKSVQLIPSHYFKSVDSKGKGADIPDLYLAIFSNTKVSIYRLRELAENRFPDTLSPCYTLDHIVTNGIN